MFLSLSLSAEPLSLFVSSGLGDISVNEESCESAGCGLRESPVSHVVH